MELIGFVLFCIGVMLFIGAKRIVMGKLKLESKDKDEMELLAGGAVIAVKLAGFVIIAVGFIFLLM